MNVNTYNNFQTERTTVCPGKEFLLMSSKEKLEKFVASLTPEQVEKIVNHFQLLTSSLEEPAPPYLPEQTLRNP